MIRFPCHCGYRFEVPAEMAASAIQCPKCGLLNDVPTLSELNHLSEDGTVLLKEDTPPAHRPRRNSEAFTSFRRAHIDRTGDDVDLRNSYDDLANVGADPEPDTIPLTADDLYRLGITAAAAIGARILQRPGGLTDLESKAIQAAAQGRLRPVIGQRYALADAAAAHTAIESRSTTGKTILRP